METFGGILEKCGEFWILEAFWRIEVFLMHIYNNNVFYRWGTNKILFRASNLFGRNINNRISQTENIGRFFNETPHWKDIIQLIITTFN